MAGVRRLLAKEDDEEAAAAVEEQVGRFIVHRRAATHTVLDAN